MPHASSCPFTEKTKSFLQGRQLLTHRPATIGANTCQVDCLKMKTVTPSQIDRLIFDILEDFPRLHREIQQKLALQKVLASLWICNASSLVGATWAPDSPIKVISPNMCTIAFRGSIKSVSNLAPMVHSVHDICDLFASVRSDIESLHLIMLWYAMNHGWFMLWTTGRSMQTTYTMCHTTCYVVPFKAWATTTKPIGPSPFPRGGWSMTCLHKCNDVVRQEHRSAWFELA